MKKFKFYKKEDRFDQEEKHEAYTKAGYELTRQQQKESGVIIRTWEKKIN